MVWLTGLLGVLLGLAPFVLGYRDNTAAMWTSMILGAVVIVAALVEVLDVRKAKWEWWVAGIAGILTIVAPFAFGFTAPMVALSTTIILGALIVILSGYEVFFVQGPV